MKLGQFLQMKLRKVEKPNQPYLRLGVKSHGKGTFTTIVEDPNKISMSHLYRVRSGDLIVSITFAWEGAIAIVGDDEDGALVSHRFPTYTFDENIVVSDYFKYLMLSKKFFYKLGLISPGGAGRNRVMSKKDFLKLKVLVPPMPEQRKIVKIFSTWDEAITLTEKLIEALQQRKNGLMQRLLTGDVRFSEFDFHPWSESNIGEMCKTYSGGTPSRSTKSYYGGSIPWIKSGEINKKIITETEETLTEDGLNNSSAKIVEIDTVLLALYGATAGKIGITKIRATTNQAILAIIPTSEQLTNQYLFYELDFQMPIILRKLQGGQPNLSAKLVKNSQIKIPPLPEQRKISEILQTSDKEIDLQTKKLAAIKEQKKGLMQRLLTGQNRVTVD